MRFLCLLLLGSQLLYAQDEEMIRLLEDQAGQEDVREAEEDIQQLRSFQLKPLNVNIAQREDLAVFPFLSSLHIEQLLLYRKYAGKLVDVRELQAVPGWDLAIIRKIIPYVTVQETPSIKETMVNSWNKGRQQVLLRSTFSKNAGVLMRYQFNSPHLQFGVNVEKDAREKIWQGKKGMSFFSANIMVKNMGLIRSLVVGDYLLNLGQGLVIWQGRAVRKTGMPIMIKRQLPVLMPYRSNDENRYFRGAAIHIVKGRIETAFHISLNGLDANVQTDSSGHGSFVSSFLNTGYHRDIKELADKNAVSHFSYGGMVAFNQKRLRITASTVFHSFSIPIKRVDEPYNVFSARGRAITNQSLNYHYTWRNLHVFGELAADRERDPAFVNGLMMAVDPKLDISLMVRKISRGYRSFFANAFTESSEPVNETGIYTGISFRPGPRLSVDAYADHYHFPWLRYRVDGPGTGRDYLLQISFKPSKQTSFYARFRAEQKPRNLPGSIITIRNVRSSNTRIHIQQKFNSVWEWRLRLEFNEIHIHQNLQPESGFLLYSDWFWTPANKPFAFNFRAMLCETSSYESRVYAYENDVMYYNIVPGFYGNSARAYLNASLQPTKPLKIFIKIAKNFPNMGAGWATRWQLVFSF